MIEDDCGKLVSTIISVVLLTVTLLFLYGVFIWEKAYKAGQVDALTKSKIIYELVVNPDSTRSWKKVKQ